MTPSVRTMPIVYAYRQRERAWRVALPGGVYRVVASRAAVGRLVAREAPGSAVAYASVPPTKH